MNTIKQFHVKLADALRAVQSSEVGEDPAKAEGAMNMLDEFQQSIGTSMAHRFLQVRKVYVFYFY